MAVVLGLALIAVLTVEVLFMINGVVIDRIENGLAFVERWEVVEGRI